jgi:hypothetical protein
MNDVTNHRTVEQERDELRECLKREVALISRLIRERDEARARLRDLLGIYASDEEQIPCEHDFGGVFCFKCGQDAPQRT